MKQDAPILVVNAGSSSLKIGLFLNKDGDERLLLSVEADDVFGTNQCGQLQGKLKLRRADNAVVRTETLTCNTQSAALHIAAGWLAESAPAPCAIGHRVVHGGPCLTTHQKITPALIAELNQCTHLAPLHTPLALALMNETQRTYPDIPEYACFDTAFHTTLPMVAKIFPLPRRIFDAGIHRYGFHGLSYESILYQLGLERPSRIIIAHLGSGASLVAIKDGLSVDTTMGLTPTGGIPMATRCGDLDPGLLLYLLRSDYQSADALEQLFNNECGLKALSGGRFDMLLLEEAATHGDLNAELAIEIFVRAIAKTIGSYIVVLGGLDLLVFTGGIGEHSVSIRAKVCSQLSCFDIHIDTVSNHKQQHMISTVNSESNVFVLPSEEDRQIARHCRRLSI